MLMAIVLTVWALYLIRRLSGTSGPRMLAESQLLQMYLLAERLRKRHDDQTAGDVSDLNAQAEQLIHQQFELRPVLRAQGDAYAELLSLGARLCQELNAMQLSSGPADVARRIRGDHVSRAQIERELHGPLLRRLPAPRS